MPDIGIAPGQVLDGRYRIERRLGKGGVGQVFLGRHQRTGRPCAIKLLSPEGGLDQSSLRRFEREARTLGSLGHPGIVGIHDFSETPEGVPYLVMDFLDGEDLAQRLSREGAMSWETARTLFREMAHALHAAHRSGVLHRDLKPGNVFLARAPGAPDRAVLLDFGLAKAETGEQEELSLTRTGAIFGTPLYMSPEQARGARLDQRSDLYSLATILFEMLAGRPPYVGTSLTQLVSRLLLDPVPLLSELASNAVPAHLDGVLGVALCKEPEDRYPSVVAFAEAVLEEPLSEAWAHPTTPVSEMLLATIPSEPPQTGGPGAPSSPVGQKAPLGVASSQPPAALLESAPRDRESLANQATLASGDSLEGRVGAETGGDRAPRRGASSWILHLGIFLLGMAAAAAAFWLLLGRGPATGSDSKTGPRGAAVASAPGGVRGPGSHGATSGPGAEGGGSRGTAARVDAGASLPRAAPSTPGHPSGTAEAPSSAHPHRVVPIRPGAARPRSEPRLARASTVPDAKAPSPVPASSPPMALAGTPPTFGEKMFAAGLLRGKAITAERQGKGRDCLSLLDQADRVHPESAGMYRYLRGWCLMRVGRCAEGRLLLVKYYEGSGVSEISSKATVEWAESAKCPATSGSPAQQLVRVHQQLTTACGMFETERCAGFARMLKALVPKLPRPVTGPQNNLIHEGYLRAGICLGKAARCADARRLFRSAAAVYSGSSSQTEEQAERHLRAYAQGCPTSAGEP